MISGIRNVFIIFPLLWGCASAFETSDMQLGFYRYSGSITEQQRNLVWDLEDAALSKGAGEFRSIQAVVAAGESKWGVLSDKLDIGIIDLANGTVLASWPLTRWGGELSEEINDIYNFVGVPWDPERHEYSHTILPGPGGAGIGCLHAQPLRYGDINESGEGEVVLFLGLSSLGTPVGHLDMVVFSPVKQRIIFSVRLVHADVGEEITGDNYPAIDRLSGFPQFRSSEHQQGIGAPAMQAYAKIYLGDFNEDGVHDILVWRKRYESLRIGDDGRGFVLAAELLNHYQLGDQGYILRETPEATIRSWLTANDLTWQSGFPTYSECPGQEGQLIPEMHDPLLNDPDVLQ